MGSTAACRTSATESFSYDVAANHLDAGSPPVLNNPVQNHAPITVDDNAGVQFGTQLVVGAADGVLSNDVDPDGDELSVTSITGGTIGSPVAGQHGSLTLNADGSFSYAPTARTTWSSSTSRWSTQRSSPTTRCWS